MNNMIDVKALKGLTQDSRAVRKGYLFAALPGSKYDGRNYIGDAVRNGATTILASAGTPWPKDVPEVKFITDQNPRRLLALMAAEFYGKQPERIVAVTGTNGKTSTVHFVKQLWQLQGLKAASIGTLGVRGPGMVRSGSMTTPDPVSLHAELADLAAAGVTHLAMEASSHGLDQYRLDGVHIAAAGFTNFTRDHLDYHISMDAYRAAKTRLFSEILKPGDVAVLNTDIPEFESLKQLATSKGCNVLTFGTKAKDLKLVKLSPTPSGQDLSLEIFGKKHQVTLPVVGEFQAMNALCALGLVLSGEREKADVYTQGLAQLQGPPGRLQLVAGHPANAAVYIDYAHTPDALETVLKALRAHTHGKIVCIFGCGGDRDRGKRPVMGKIATDLADKVIVTDDNPRSENPASIRQEILTTAKGASEIGNRHEAIEKAVMDLKEGDVLLIAGKGHEQGQIFADRTDPFDDYNETLQVLKKMRKT